MPLILVANLKGSPGATATAAGLAAAWPRTNRVLVEADPSGGVLAARWRLRSRPGLVEVASHLSDPERALETGFQEAHHLGGVFPVVCAPAQAPQAEPAVDTLCDRGTGVLTPPDRWVIADIGRLGPVQDTWGLLKLADAVIVVTYGSVAGVLALHGMAPALVEQCGLRLAVLVAPGDYGADDVNGTLVTAGLDVAVLGEMPTEATGRRRPRRPVSQAWREIAEQVFAHANGTPLAVTEGSELSEAVS